MVAQAIAPLEHLAAVDPTVAPLARLQAAALQAAEDPAWAVGILPLDGGRVERAAPLLQGATLSIDVGRLRALLLELAHTLREAGHGEAERLGALFASAELDPLEVLHASLVQDHARLEAGAQRVSLEAGVLAVVSHAATLPLLLACGRRAAGVLQVEAWPHGYCPVCAAWPILAEVRGLERNLFLRCGRCGSGWPFEHRRCPFCGNLEHRSQSYFAAEQERETRRAIACDRCRSYFKSQASLGPLALPELLLRDLETLELDVAALEHQYGRPAAPGWELSLRVEPLRRRTGWLRW